MKQEEKKKGKKGKKGKKMKKEQEEVEAGNRGRGRGQEAGGRRQEGEQGDKER